MKHRILLVDDSQMFLDFTRNFLEDNGFEVHTAISGEQGVERFKQDRLGFSLVILDFKMGRKDGAGAARDILSEVPDQFILMCSSDMSRDALQESWQAGAVEFIDKGASKEDFLKVVCNWCQKHKDNHVVATPLTPTDNMRRISSIGLVGTSSAMARVADLVHNFKKQKSSVLILGESGTGKERIANALHPDKKFPFRAVNCAAYNGEATLMESELFGIEKGSFTGATHDKKGVFEEVGSGTVFLDEVHTLSLRAQQKLLRVLQERTVRPVGSTREYKVHFRLVAAAKPDLERLIEKGEFLMDLYYRLNVLRTEIPTLRERPEDIPLLVSHFAAVHSPDPSHPKQFVGRAMNYLEAYSWPGNVRELENTVERLCAVVPSGIIQPDDLEAKFFQAGVVKRVNSVTAFRKQVDFMTKELVVRALQESRSQREAARRLGVAKSTFHDLVRRYGLEGGKRGRKPKVASDGRK